MRMDVRSAHTDHGYGRHEDTKATKTHEEDFRGGRAACRVQSVERHPALRSAVTVSS